MLSRYTGWEKIKKTPLNIKRRFDMKVKALIFLGVIGFFGCAVSRKELIEEGKRYMGKGLYTLAEVSLERALSTDVKNKEEEAEIYYLLGMIRYERFKNSANPEQNLFDIFNAISYFEKAMSMVEEGSDLYKKFEKRKVNAMLVIISKIYSPALRKIEVINMDSLGKSVALTIESLSLVENISKYAQLDKKILDEIDALYEIGGVFLEKYLQIKMAIEDGNLDQDDELVSQSLENYKKFGVLLVDIGLGLNPYAGPIDAHYLYCVVNSKSIGTDVSCARLNKEDIDGCYLMSLGGSEIIESRDELIVDTASGRWSLRGKKEIEKKKRAFGKFRGWMNYKGENICILQIEKTE
jgi:tetratricopeptide (TPR) repeat protein